MDTSQVIFHAQLGLTSYRNANVIGIKQLILEKINFEISHEREYTNNFIFQLREKDYITYNVTVVLHQISRET